jgi:hypothetical protein
MKTSQNNAFGPPTHPKHQFDVLHEQLECGCDL